MIAQARGRAVMAPEQAGKLLDQVVYERVLSFFDLEELQRFELELSAALFDCGVDDDEVAQVAKEMIDKAFGRLADEPRRYMTFGEPFGDCALCAAEEAQGKPAG